MKLKNEVEKLYHVEGWSIQAIADHCGCSTSYIMELLGIDGVYKDELH